MEKLKDDVVIVSALRTPFGKFDGVLRSVPSLDLGVIALRMWSGVSISILAI
jgi:acetyl-CoA C-acetyltransferase